MAGTLRDDVDFKVALAQLHNLILALRSNNRFSSRARFMDMTKDDTSDNPLMASAIHLRSRLYMVREKDALQRLDILQPFINAVLTPDSTGPVPLVALTAFMQFLEMGCSFVGIQQLYDMSNAAMNARLEVADSQSHEAVLAGIVQVLVDCVKHSCGDQISEDHLLKMLHACFNISAAGPPEPSELLQQTAKQAIQTIIQVVFTRVHDSLQASHAMPPVNESARQELTPRQMYVGLLQFACQMITCDSVQALLVAYGYGESDIVGESTTIKLFRVRLLGLNLAYTILITLKSCLSSAPECHGLLSAAVDDLARSLLKIIRLRNPNVVVLQMALAVIHLLVTYASPFLQMQTLSFVIAGHLMPYTARLQPPPRSPVTPASPSSMAGAIWEISDEHGEMLMESLIEWCSDPGFLPYLYWNYDCNISCPNAFEMLCKFLNRGAATAAAYSKHLGMDDSFEQPTSGPAGSPKQPLGMPAIRHLSLSCLVTILLTITSRCCPPDHPQPLLTGASVVKQRKKVKVLIHHIAKVFAEKPKKAVEFLVVREDPEHAAILDELGLPVPFDGEQLGRFIWKFRSMFDKDELGAYISEPGRNPEGMPQETEKLSAEDCEKLRWKPGTTPFHEGVLRGYFNSFNFKQLNLLTALRKLLNSFKLPGEAQKIDRIVLAFSNHWISSNSDTPPTEDGAAFNPFVDADACYVFCFSIIMLTTDRHSSQIQEKDKITFEGWRANNRGINGGKDVPDAFQRKIYNEICANQIQMKDPIFESWDDGFVWHEVLEESTTLYAQSKEDQEKGIVPQVAFGSTDPRIGFLDAEIFHILWRPAMTSFSLVLQSYDDVICQTSLVFDDDDAELGTTGGLMSSSSGGTMAHALIGASRVEGLLRQAVQGYMLCAKVAQHHVMCHALDALVASLWRFVAPALSVPTDTQGGSSRGANIINQRQSIIFRFGRSCRAMLAFQAIFQIARTCGIAQRESWKNVVQLFTTAFLLELLPEQQELVGDEDEELFFLSQRSTSPILHRRPSREKVRKSKGQDASEDGGGSGWFSLFGGSRSEKFRQDEKQYQQSVLQATACVQGSRISDMLFVDSKLLDGQSLVHMLKALILNSGVPLNPSSLLPMSSPISPSSPFSDHSPPEPADAPIAGSTLNPQTDAYITGFCLHVLVDVAIANKERFPMIAPYVEHFAAMLLYGVRLACGIEGDAPFRYPQDRASQMALQYWVVTGENIVMALLRLTVRIIDQEALHPHLFKILALLDAVSPALFSSLVSEHYINAMYVLLKGKLFAYVKGRDYWEILLSLAQKSGLFSRKRDRHVRRMAFQLLCCVTNLGQFVWPDNVPTLVSGLTSIYFRLLNEEAESNERMAMEQEEVDDDDRDDDWEKIPAYGSGHRRKAEDTEVPLKAVDLLYSLHERLLASAPTLSSPSPAWTRAWFTILTGLSSVTTHGVAAKEESDGLLALQKCVLAPQLAALPPPKALELFVAIIMPFLDKTFTAAAGPASAANAPGGFRILGFLFSSPEQPKPSTTMAWSPAAIEDLQNRALTLTSKAFLHYMLPLSKCPQDFPMLWSQIIVAFATFSKQCPKPERLTAIKESIKNMILVMANCAGAERDKMEDQRVFAAYPRFWTNTMDELSKHFDFAEQLNEYIRGALSVSAQRSYSDPQGQIPAAGQPTGPSVTHFNSHVAPGAYRSPAYSGPSSQPGAHLGFAQGVSASPSQHHSQQPGTAPGPQGHMNYHQHHQHHHVHHYHSTYPPASGVLPHHHQHHPHPHPHHQQQQQQQLGVQRTHDQPHRPPSQQQEQQKGPSAPAAAVSIAPIPSPSIPPVPPLASAPSPTPSDPSPTTSSSSSPNLPFHAPTVARSPSLAGEAPAASGTATSPSSTRRSSGGTLSLPALPQFTPIPALPPMPTLPSQTIPGLLISPSKTNTSVKDLPFPAFTPPLMASQVTNISIPQVGSGPATPTADFPAKLHTPPTSTIVGGQFPASPLPTPISFPPFIKPTSTPAANLNPPKPLSFGTGLQSSPSSAPTPPTRPLFGTPVSIPASSADII